MLVITGTGTGVGKTVVTAAVAALAICRGLRVAVLKPVQTGAGPDEPGDIDEVLRLAPGVTTRELTRYPDPLAPATAARRAAAASAAAASAGESGILVARIGHPGRASTAFRSPSLAPVTPDAAATAAAELAEVHDLVLVEGAGGLLVRFVDDPPGTLADVAAKLAAPVLVVAAAGLGTLNHTALTVEALTARGLTCAGVVIGAWPAAPDLAARCNLADLPDVTGVPLLGMLPDGAGALPPGEFADVARHSLAVELGGGWQTPQP